MVLAESTATPIGSAAPDFTLPEPLSGNEISLNNLQGSAVLLVFMCNHCPYVVHILDGLVAAAHDFAAEGIETIAISANDITTHPADSPEKMAALARQKNFPFRYLYDESQSVARAYHAVCTPDIYLYDSQHKLFYRGQFDASRPGSGVDVTGSDLRQAADAMLKGENPPQNPPASVGCSIKWKAA